MDSAEAKRQALRQQKLNRLKSIKETAHAREQFLLSSGNTSLDSFIEKNKVEMQQQKKEQLIKSITPPKFSVFKWVISIILCCCVVSYFYFSIEDLNIEQNFPLRILSIIASLLAIFLVAIIPIVSYLNKKVCTFSGPCQQSFLFPILFLIRNDIKFKYVIYKLVMMKTKLHD